jgi:hypothetical protein
MSTSRLYTPNYLDSDKIAAASASSALAAYPAANLYDGERRSKVWRSAGCWEITAANQTIVFQETVGVDKTATVAAATYQTTAAFLAAVKAALEAAGDSTYTVSQDTTTKKLKIVSNGAGGGGVFRLRWTVAASSGFAAAAGFATDLDDTGALTYTADELRIHTSEWFLWDFGIPTNPKAFAAIGARNRAIKITPAATLLLQGSETNAWTMPTFEAAVAYDDFAMGLSGSDGLHTGPLRYWRFKIVDAGNPLGYVELGSLFLGDMFEPARGAITFPFQGTYLDLSTTVFSEGGQSASDKREKSEAFQLSWDGLTTAEKEDIDRFWDEVGTYRPFFAQLDPALAFSSVASKFIRYCKLDGQPQTSLTSPGVWACTMTLREEL